MAILFRSVASKLMSNIDVLEAKIEVVSIVITGTVLSI